jgi:acyl carrier protein
MVSMSAKTMDAESLLASARRFLEERRGIAPEVVQMTSRFEELDVDSLDLAEMRMEIEDEYRVEIETDSLLDVETVADVIRMVLETATEMAPEVG